MPTTLKRTDLVYPELSYQIVGVLFTVFNALGYGYREKYYQRAIQEELKKLQMPFQEQISFPVVFKGQIIGRQIFDFLIDKKVVLEIKRGNFFSKTDIVQTTGYLKTANLKLGILARFSSKGLKFKRIINIH
ncbi:MAG: GxxExxY protein [bacterium]|nr:GxxExxY protein [bacterium]